VGGDTLWFCKIEARCKIKKAIDSHNKMNREECQVGWFTDNLIQTVDSQRDRCSQPEVAWFGLFGFIIGLSLVTFLLQSIQWFRIHFARAAYSKKRKNRYSGSIIRRRFPVIPVLSFFLVALMTVFFATTTLNLVNFDKGTSLAMLHLAMLPGSFYEILALRRFLSLGLKILPLANRIFLEQQLSSSHLSSTDVDTGDSKVSQVHVEEKLSRFDMVRLGFNGFWFASAVRPCIGVIFGLIFPANYNVVTIMYSIQAVGDVGISMIILHLERLLTALGRINSNPKQHQNFIQSRQFIRVIEMCLIFHLLIVMGVHVIIAVGIREWWLVMAEPALGIFFHAVYTFYSNCKRARNQKLPIKDVVELGHNNQVAQPNLMELEFPDGQNQNLQNRGGSKVKALRSDLPSDSTRRSAG
jgi:hypothetical protein